MATVAADAAVVRRETFAGVTRAAERIGAAAAEVRAEALAERLRALGGLSVERDGGELTVSGPRAAERVRAGELGR